MTEHAQEGSQPVHCPHFGPCGGCSWLDVAPEVQLERKRALVYRGLAAVLGSPPPEIESEPPRLLLHDRTKLIYPFQVQEPRGTHGGGVRAGMYRRGTHDVVDIHTCRIQDRGLTHLANRIRDLVTELAIPIDDPRTGAGFLRSLVLRVAPGTEETLAVLVTRSGLFPQGNELALAIRAQAQGTRTARGRPLRLVGVLRNINDSRGNTVLSTHWVPLLGRDWQVDHSSGLDFRISAASFYQVSRRAEALLYRPALELAGDVVGATVIDAYSGVGCFALRLARAGATRVVALEESPAACADAVENARRNALADRVEVRQGKVEELLDGVDREPRLVVVDPPRAGLGLGCAAALAATRPERILYVSCNIANLARDLPPILAAGYRLVRLRLCELFPHTERLEVIALLTRA